jgi:hypothetical protein
MKKPITSIDRQIAFWGGWIGGPAFGVAMMAAPEYFKLQPTVAASCFWAGILVFACTVFVVFALSAREQERKHRSMWPIGLMALGAVIFGVGVAAFFWPTSMPHAEPAEHKPQESSAELLLECQLMALPSVGLPKENTLVMIVPFRFEKEGTIGFSGTPTEPGQPIKWPDEWKNKMASSARCRLTNYGKTTLFKVELPFKVAFIRIQRGENPGSTTAKEIINIAQAALPTTKIEPGSDGAYVFYVHNQGRDVLQTEFINAATHVPPGATTREPVTLIQSTSIIHHAGSLWPMRSLEEILAEEENSKGQK